LSHLFARTEATEPFSHSPSESLHRFLRGIVEVTGEDTKGKRHSEGIFELHSNILKSLALSKSLQQQELGLQIIKYQPRLVTVAWSSLSKYLLPLELSTDFLASISLISKIVSAPLSLNPHVPPSIQTLLDSIFPYRTNSKQWFTKSLQSKNEFIRYSVASLLRVSLEKASFIQKSLRALISTTHELDKERWVAVQYRLTTQLKAIYPDRQIIISLISSNSSTDRAFYHGDFVDILTLYQICMSNSSQTGRFDPVKLFKLDALEELQTPEQALFLCSALEYLQVSNLNISAITINPSSVPRNLVHVLLQHSLSPILSVSSRTRRVLHDLMNNTWIGCNSHTEIEHSLHVLERLQDGSRDDAVHLVEELLISCLKNPLRVISLLSEIDASVPKPLDSCPQSEKSDCNINGTSSILKSPLFVELHSKLTSTKDTSKSTLLQTLFDELIWEYSGSQNSNCLCDVYIASSLVKSNDITNPVPEVITDAEVLSLIILSTRKGSVSSFSDSEFQKVGISHAIKIALQEARYSLDAVECSRALERLENLQDAFPLMSSGAMKSMFGRTGLIRIAEKYSHQANIVKRRSRIQQARPF
jgi:hypothetical protein